MEFIIATINEALAHGIVVLPTYRQSVDKTKVVLHWDMVQHVDYFETFKRYLYDSKELNDLMNSAEWTSEDMEQPNEDYAKIKAMQILNTQTTANINNVNLSNKEINDVVEFLPKWEDYIGKSLNKGFKIQYNNKPHKVLKGLSNIVSNHTPDITKSEYGLISEHDGTKDDPIPYEHWILIEKDVYYIQNGKLYIGILDAPNGYGADLETLSTLVKEVKE